MEQRKAQLRIPLPTIRRLPAYLRVMRRLQAAGSESVSAMRIAEALDLEPIQVRKDLALTGATGRPRIGFEISATIDQIEEFLGWNSATQAFLVGAGHLGSALLGYEGFDRHGLEIVAAFDVNPELVGEQIGGTEILPMAKFADLVRRLHVRVIVLAVPAAVAQEVADEAIGAGIRGIWNFAPCHLQVPEGVIVQNEDLSVGLAVLTSRVSDQLRSSGSVVMKAVD